MQGRFLVKEKDASMGAQEADVCGHPRFRGRLEERDDDAAREARGASSSLSPP